MINSSAAFQSAIAQDSRLFRARLLMAGTPIAGDIKTIKIHKGSCGSSEFSPGICFCPYIEAVIDNLTVAVEGVELQLQIGIMTGGDYSDPILDYITIGYFTAGKPETSVYRSTFTAQGRIAARMSGAFVPPDELTVASVAAKLQADTGVSIILAAGLDTSVPIAGTMNNLTCREALAVLAAVVGGYATETAEGEVKVDVFSNTVTASYAADNMLEPPVFADYDVLITGVEVIAVESSEDVEEVSYRSGDPVNVVISNSYMTENAFAQFAANIIGLQYRPGSVPLSLGDPRLEPWDVLQITDAAGISFIVPCMNLVHTYDGGFATDIEAPALPDETQVPSQIEKAIKIALGANYKVLLSNSGMVVYDGAGVEVATYGESISFNATRPQYIGGEDAYIIFYDSDSDGVADSIRMGGNKFTFGGGKKLSDILTSLDISTRQTATGAEITVGDKTVNLNNGSDGEDAVVLRVDSSRGNVFKNNAVSTVLTVNIIKAGDIITNAIRMREVFGNSAYIQWYWKRLDDTDFHTIVNTDPMISQDGFALTLSSDKVDGLVQIHNQAKLLGGMHGTVVLGQYQELRVG